MVEAAGIEPASGNVQHKVSTGLVRTWFSFSGLPPDRLLKTSPGRFSLFKLRDAT